MAPPLHVSNALNKASWNLMPKKKLLIAYEASSTSCSIVIVFSFKWKPAASPTATPHWILIYVGNIASPPSSITHKSLCHCVFINILFESCTVLSLF